MGFQKIFLSLVFFSLLPTQSFASESAEVEKLLTMERRPQYADIVRAFGGQWPSENPINLPLRMRTVDSIMEKLPKVILALEQSFPGGTYAFLGRDVGTLGDFVQMVYAFHFGQTDRVKFFDASKESFPSWNNFDDNYPYILGHLKKIGFDIDKINEQKHPWVVVDVASWRDMSQLRQVMRAGYRRYAENGGNPKELVRKYNVLAVGMGFYREFTETDFEPQGYLNAMAQTASAEGIGVDPIYLDVQSTFAYLHTLWHGVFSKFQMQPDGTAITYPGEPAPRVQKLDALFEIFEGAKVIASPQFRDALEATFREAGFEVPTKRVKALTGTAAKTYVYRERPVYSGGMGFGPSGGSYMSPLAKEWKTSEKDLGQAAQSQKQVYIDRYNEIIEGDFSRSKARDMIIALSLNFLEDVAGMAARRSYNAKEFVYLVRLILMDFFANGPKGAENKKLHALLMKEEALRAVWDAEILAQEQEYVIAGAMKNGLAAFRRYLEVEKLEAVVRPKITYIFGAKKAFQQKAMTISPMKIPECNQAVLKALQEAVDSYRKGLFTFDDLIEGIVILLEEFYGSNDEHSRNILSLFVIENAELFNEMVPQMKPLIEKSSRKMQLGAAAEAISKGLDIAARKQCEEGLVEE